MSCLVSLGSLHLDVIYVRLNNSVGHVERESLSIRLTEVGFCLENLVIDFHIDEMSARLVDNVLVGEHVDLDDRIGAVGETPHVAGGTAVDLDAATSPRVIIMLVIHACILMIFEVLHRLMLPVLILFFTA